MSYFAIANNRNDHSEICHPIEWDVGSGINGECYIASDNGKALCIRMNDFPEEPLYTLIINGEDIIHFDDWPKKWIRPGLPEMKWQFE